MGEVVVDVFVVIRGVVKARRSVELTADFG
jgi:hypothetical protein